jgi:choline dehydrogenase-like flavoprotein
VLERGNRLPKDPVRNRDPRAVFTEGIYRPDEVWHDADGNAFSPFTHYCVGGNTKMYGAALLRLRESDFEDKRHYGGVSPAWPIRYSDLEPYYTEVEKLYHVHGEAGLDPTEPTRSEPYPFPALPHEPRMQQLFDDFRRLGCRPFPIPIALRLDRGADYPREMEKLSAFDGYPDPTDVKADADVVALASALRHDNVELLTNAYAERLETDGSGRQIARVVVTRNGQTETYEADIVVSACGAINSAALLLRSANDRHPDGLANGSGLVGRNYMSHHNGTLLAISKTPNPSKFQKTFGLTDFYHGADDSELPLGTIQLMGKTDPDTLAQQAGELFPDMSVEEISGHSIDFFLTAEDLPHRENRVGLERDGSIRLSYKPTNLGAYDRLRARLVSMLDGLDCHAKEVPCSGSVYVGDRLSIGGVSHQNGTLRFGADPQGSVLNLDCRAHEVDNLYVVDASFFVSAGAVNPSLTIMANALRVGDHLIERMR